MNQSEHQFHTAYAFIQKRRIKEIRQKVGLLFGVLVLLFSSSAFIVQDEIPKYSRTASITPIESVEVIEDEFINSSKTQTIDLTLLEEEKEVNDEFLSLAEETEDEPTPPSVSDSSSNAKPIVSAKVAKLIQATNPDITNVHQFYTVV